MDNAHARPAENRAQPPTNTVALVRWSTKPAEHPVVRFVVLCTFGLVLCLFLMIFLPGLRSGGAIALFTLSFGVLLTLPAVSARRSFMRGLIQRVNDTLAEVSDTPSGQLSARDFQRLMRSGDRLPLLVGGVPGLNLQIERLEAADPTAPQKWLAVFTVVPPEDGAGSFDRLVAAAIGSGPGSSTPGATGISGPRIGPDVS